MPKGSISAQVDDTSRPRWLSRFVADGRAILVALLAMTAVLGAETAFLIIKTIDVWGEIFRGRIEPVVSRAVLGAAFAGLTFVPAMYALAARKHGLSIALLALTSVIAGDATWQLYRMVSGEPVSILYEYLAVHRASVFVLSFIALLPAYYVFDRFSGGRFSSGAPGSPLLKRGPINGVNAVVVSVALLLVAQERFGPHALAGFRTSEESPGVALFLLAPAVGALLCRRLGWSSAALSFYLFLTLQIVSLMYTRSIGLPSFVDVRIFIPSLLGGALLLLAMSFYVVARLAVTGIRKLRRRRHSASLHA